MPRKLHRSPRPRILRRSWGSFAPLWGAILVFFLASISACGPYRSKAAIRDAEAVRDTVTKNSQPRDNGQQSPSNISYELAKGNAFLRHARLSAGHSDHTGAIEFAQIAREAYIQAQIKLENSAVSPTTPQTSPPPAGRQLTAP